eukprot:TRINITY_DN36825_c0_g1_i4.p2 TRINITY_DN36825_c0_g1~~TRINITY_DN36825_c0_g1_i4.p2  ORF type:complete len:142 (-),score=27.06 TRINITY_DN36825_c0_g1_i4:122-547(-)
MEVEVPDEVQSQLNNMEEILQQFDEAIEAAIKLKSSSELAPLQEAHLQLLLARSGQAVYDIFMNTLGKESDSKTNHQRLKAYTKKVQQSETQLLQTEEQQNLKLDIQAANRFIEHALPELTKEQKQLMKQVRNNVACIMKV